MSVAVNDHVNSPSGRYEIRFTNQTMFQASLFRTLALLDIFLWIPGAAASLPRKYSG